jgi:hypothetical protein
MGRKLSFNPEIAALEEQQESLVPKLSALTAGLRSEALDGMFECGHWDPDSDETYAEVYKTSLTAQISLLDRLISLETDEQRLIRAEKLNADQLQTLVDHKRQHPEVSFGKLLDYTDGMP